MIVSPLFSSRYLPVASQATAPMSMHFGSQGGSRRGSPRQNHPKVFLARLRKAGLTLPTLRREIEAQVSQSPGSLPQGTDAYGVGIEKLPRYWFRVPKKRDSKALDGRLVLKSQKTGLEGLRSVLLPFASFDGIEVMPKATGSQPFSLRTLGAGLRNEIMVLKNGFRPDELSAWLKRFRIPQEFTPFAALCQQRGLLAPVGSRPILSRFEALEDEYVGYLEQLAARPKSQFEHIRKTLDKTKRAGWVADFHVPDNVFITPKGFQLIDLVPVPPETSVDTLATYHDHSMGGFVRALMGETIFTSPQTHLASLLIRPQMQTRSKQAIQGLRRHAELAS